MDRGPRGALKYYPIRAIDDPDFYQAWCDAYFASLSLLEVVSGEKIYSKMGTAEAIQARRDCVDPEIPETLSETFARSIQWIEEIWKLEKSER